MNLAHSVKLARPLRLAAIAAIVTTGATGLVSSSPAVASAAPAVVRTASLPPLGTGIDLSYPQCAKRSHIDLPPNTPFAVVGVNGGSANNSNACFASEYNSAFLLAGGTEQPRAAVYVNTGNPALAGAWWPSGNQTQSGTTIVDPNGPCTGLAGAACAYIYGYSMAEADYRRVSRAHVLMPALWWLDVETSNTWQPDVVANTASLAGMVDYFKSRHLDVGIYSTSYQWNRIAGVTPSTSVLAGLPSWLAGGSFFGAPVDCEKSPLTPGGRVAMIQFSGHFDRDYSCGRFAATMATITPATQPSAGDQLTAQSGTWAEGTVSYTYQWNRDGAAIPGATAGDYTVTEQDAGTALSVTITGLKPGYSAASQTSKPVAVLAPSID